MEWISFSSAPGLPSKNFQGDVSAQIAEVLNQHKLQDSPPIRAGYFFTTIVLWKE
jgi:inosine/xanthosine triphosphate pyrophosphatase family protein